LSRGPRVCLAGAHVDQPCNTEESDVASSGSPATSRRRDRSVTTPRPGPPRLRFSARGLLAGRVARSGAASPCCCGGRRLLALPALPALPARTSGDRPPPRSHLKTWGLFPGRGTTEHVDEPGGWSRAERAVHEIRWSGIASQITCMSGGADCTSLKRSWLSAYHQRIVSGAPGTATPGQPCAFRMRVVTKWPLVE